MFMVESTALEGKTHRRRRRPGAEQYSRGLCRSMVSRNDHYGDRGVTQDLRCCGAQEYVSRLSGCPRPQQQHVAGFPWDTFDGLAPIVAAANHDFDVWNRDIGANIVELLHDIVHRP